MPSSLIIILYILYLKTFLYKNQLIYYVFRIYYRKIHIVLIVFLSTSIYKKLKNFKFEIDCVHEEIISLLYCIILFKQNIYSLDNLFSKNLRKNFERRLISLIKKNVKLFNIDSNDLIKLFIYIIKLRRILII